MNRDNLVYTICGFVLGLVIGSFLLGPKLAQSKLAGNNAASAPTMAGATGGGMPGGGAMAASADAAPGNQMGAVFQQIASLKERIARNPNDTDSLLQLANMYMDVSKFPQAIEYYEQALRVRDDPNVRTDLGICYKQAGQLDKAYAEFTRVAQQSPGQWQPLYNLTIVLAEMKRYDEARAELAKLEQLRPGDPDVAKLKQALDTAK